ncbi:MAG: BCD family MFS transporter [Chloroherpetonaceae bacterium]|nr:BCD family MFS transporter [Chloroherpetonaceae bacterium]
MFELKKYSEIPQLTNVEEVKSEKIQSFELKKRLIGEKANTISDPFEHFRTLSQTDSIQRILQISLMQVSTAICFVLLNSTLNRVLIVEFGVSAFLVGILIGFHNLFAFIRPFIGYYSDHHFFYGFRRTHLILIGNLLVTGGTLLSVYGAVMLAQNFNLGILILLMSFTFYGIGINITGTLFYALLADKAGEKQKSKAVTIGWFILILGSIVASVFVSKGLEEFNTQNLIRVFWIGTLSAVGFTWVAMLFSEKRFLQNQTATPITINESRKVSIKKLAANPTVYRFFWFMFVTVLAIQAQDVILEPFGAHIFSMSVSETSKLTQVWGSGTMAGLLLLGLFFVGKIGAKKTTYLGCAISAIGFLVIASSPNFDKSIFIYGVFLLGVGNGALTVGSLTMMMNMTTSQNAGFFMGLWGMAQAAANFLANAFGGAVRDVALWLTGNQFIGYSTAFAIEVVALVMAIKILSTVSVEEFKKRTSEVLSEVISVAD